MLPLVEKVRAALATRVVLAAATLEDVHAERHAKRTVVLVGARLLALRDE